MEAHPAEIQNPGRYLVLMPPINGATALSGAPYFTVNPGDPFTAWDTQTTFDGRGPIADQTDTRTILDRDSNPFFYDPGEMRKLMQPLGR